MEKNSRTAQPRTRAKADRLENAAQVVWAGPTILAGEICRAESWPVQPADSALHQHLVLEILWNEAPLRLCFPERSMVLRRPTVAILPAGVLHIAKPVGDYSARRVGRDLTINVQLLQKDSEKIDLRCAILPAHHNAIVLPVLRYIHRRLRAPVRPAQHDVRDMLLGLCGMLRDLGYGAARPKEETRCAMDRAFEMLNARHRDPRLRVSDLARAASMSEPHFRRLFIQRTGRTPHELLSRMRIFHARHLLEQGHLKASAVAQQAGFGSVSTMYKQLQRRRERDAAGIK